MTFFIFFTDFMATIFVHTTVVYVRVHVIETVAIVDLIVDRQFVPDHVENEHVLVTDQIDIVKDREVLKENHQEDDPFQKKKIEKIRLGRERLQNHHKVRRKKRRK